MTGFLMGLFLGVFIEAGIVSLYRLLAGWLGWPPLEISIWYLLPFPILCGLFMSKVIADLHLEDYP
jgi:hypothetical protein